MDIRLTKTVKIPDPIKIERYRRSPDLGPKILFFSGGTALKKTCKKLIEYTDNSLHLITPFDSGGSSAKIREAFQMISVGDLRNRLMALADQNIKGNPAIYKLFSFRLPTENKPEEIISIIYEMIKGTHPLIIKIPDPMKKIICHHLRSFLNKMPIDFDLRGANIGNLLITGGYLNNNKDINSVLYIFTKLVESRGVVKPIVNKFLHLVADLEDGTTLKGQHLITGKEVPPIKSPVSSLYLVDSLNSSKPNQIKIDDISKKMIEEAELICYPMGSFYTSLIANFLPEQVGLSIAKNVCPKVYIPNSTPDPEQLDLDLFDAVKIILKYLQKDTLGEKISKFLNFVLIDSKNSSYPYELNISEIKKLGVEVIDTDLISQESKPYIDPELLIKILLSLT